MLDFAAAPRQPNSRLACQITLTDALDGLVVDLPATQY
jgi:2Fe-2S ferredoxin